ncbi:glyoxalase [Tumebacillus avium]|uniref:Glyoxalase n=1 Tax=Tumebacillus avium TaxID=1903704 RepID=A0A1Y0II54_9BACL|nr:VOC family protein [Tumebacillus avium]ARU60182.1 glyoxalase [Tumebacillus avium]
MSYSFAGIDHVQLAAPTGCEAEARRFFTELLGMPELVKPEPLRSRGGAWFICGAQQIHIGVEADFAPAKKAHPAFVVHNLDALMQRLQAQGAAYQLDEALSDRKRFFMEDPWGNRLEFMEMEAGQQ